MGSRRGWGRGSEEGWGAGGGGEEGAGGGGEEGAGGGGEEDDLVYYAFGYLVLKTCRESNN